ncbi:MAG: hypothetical protein IKZ96_01595 [Bacilli bacterium]|nr:hypothetical protein [Bacilli bacterium]
MKKGTLGLIAFIVGIVCFALAVVAGFYSDATMLSIGWFARFGQLFWVAPVVLGIIACVKKSNTKLAIIGIVLGALSFVAPFIVGIFTK